MTKPTLLFALTLFACSTVQRHAFVANHVADYVYDKPIEELWPTVKQVLSDEGFFRSRRALACGWSSRTGRRATPGRKWPASGRARWSQ